MRREAALRLLLAAVAAGALEAACDCGLVPPMAVPPPHVMLASAVRAVVSGRYAADMARSAGEAAAAAALAVAGGFFAGVLLHRASAIRGALQPWLTSYYAVPAFILYPVFIVLLGAGSPAIVAMAALLAVVAMIEATLAALDHIPPVLMKTARVQRLGPVATALRVVLPAALPRLFGGVKLAVAYAIIGVIASEFILAGAGLGYAIAYAYNDFDTPGMYGLIVLVAAAVGGVNAVLDMIDRRIRARA